MSMTMMWRLGALLCSCLMMGPAFAQQWQMLDGLTSEALGHELEAAKARHLVPVEIDSLVHDGRVLYSVVWNEDPGARWALRTGMSVTGLRDLAKGYESQGLMPVSLAIGSLADGPTYAAIWRESDGGAWQLRLDESASELREGSEALRRDGYVPFAIRGYEIDEEQRYATIWQRAVEPTGWQLRTDLTLEGLQEEYDALTPQGFAPRDLGSQDVNGAPRFAAVWIQAGDVAWQARSGLSGAEHVGFEELPGMSGFVPYAVAAYHDAGQIRYAGAWHGPEIGSPEAGAEMPAAGHASQGLPAPSETVLPIAPVVQQTPVWCWVAVGEMLFRYYGVPAANPAGDFQCGIIGRLSQPMSPCDRDCRLCIVPSGSNAGTLRMISTYTRRMVGREARFHEGNRVAPDVFVSEIDAHRPVLVGMSSSRRTFGEAEHVALVVGYSMRGQTVDLVVNDPYPYPPQANPYLANGGAPMAANQYRIPYRAFRDALFWHWTVYGLRL